MWQAVSMSVAGDIAMDRPPRLTVIAISALVTVRVPLSYFGLALAARAGILGVGVLGRFGE
jgi:hypothetical protein